MTEAQTPMRCELCKKAPEGNSKIAYCRNDKCALFAQVITRDSWDETQAALIELQRKAIKYALWREYDREPAPYKVDDLLRDYLAQRSAK